jgi:hypothetical protein
LMEVCVCCCGPVIYIAHPLSRLQSKAFGGSSMTRYDGGK